MNKLTLLSFIIPCYGSEKTIKAVTDEIIETVSQKSGYDYEIIAVNDCSPDNVWHVLNTIADNNNKVKIIDFAKNANRPGAVMAGLSSAMGDICIVMDDDGQCPMPELWRLLEPIGPNCDVSIATYPKRKQTVFKNFGTIINKKMTEFVLDRPKDLEFTNFMAMKRFIARKIIEYNNPYPYLTGLLLRTTQRITNVTMEQRGRIDNGKTNFTFAKMVSLWANGLTAFSVKPLRVATLVGVMCAIIGFIYGIFTIINKLLHPDIAVGYSSLMAILLLIGGVIMLLLGIIGEYIGRIYICLNAAPQYVIREMKNFDNETYGVKK